MQGVNWRPHVIGKPRTHGNGRCEQAQCVTVVTRCDKPFFSRFHSLALSVNIPLSGAKQSQWLHITWLDLTVVHYGILYSGANGGISLTTKMAAANGSHVPLLRLVVSLSNCIQRRFGLRLLIMPLATDNEMRGSSPARICKLGLLSVIKSWIRVLWRTQSCVRIL